MDGCRSALQSFGILLSHEAFGTITHLSIHRYHHHIEFRLWQARSLVVVVVVVVVPSRYLTSRVCPTIIDNIDRYIVRPQAAAKNFFTKYSPLHPLPRQLRAALHRQKPPPPSCTHSPFPPTSPISKASKAKQSSADGPQPAGKQLCSWPTIRSDWTIYTPILRGIFGYAANFPGWVGQTHSSGILATGERRNNYLIGTGHPLRPFFGTTAVTKSAESVEPAS